MNATQALQTREAAFVTAWVLYQRNVVGLSIMAICVLAGSDPIRGDDGSYANEGGIGRQLAKSTVYAYLKDARDQFRDEYVKRPILDMIMEEDDRLEHLADTSMQALRSAEAGSPQWFAAYDRHLRTLESRRKLLGIDRPQQVDVRHEVVEHDDPATTKLKAALVAAQARKEADLAVVMHEDDDG